MFPGRMKTKIASEMHKRMADRMFATFLLWFISKKPKHGYEIISTLGKEHQFVQVGPAHVYPMLSGLAEQGLIRVREVAVGRRVRKLYSITSLGKKQLAESKRRFRKDSIRARFMREMLS